MIHVYFNVGSPCVCRGLGPKLLRVITLAVMVICTCAQVHVHSTCTCAHVLCMCLCVLCIEQRVIPLWQRLLVTGIKIVSGAHI